MIRGRRPLAAWTLTVAAGATAVTALVVLADRPAAGRGITRPVVATAPPATVVVNGSRISADGATTVAGVLRRAGLAPRPGVYLSIVRQRRLGVPGPPARVTVDGRPARLDTPVQPGDRVAVRAGRMQLEPTELVRVRSRPPVRSPLYVGERPAIVRVVRGAVSHEVVSRQVVRGARRGHLVRPGAVALTFDDGPAPGWTPRLLRLLRRHHAHATFCVIGREAAAHPRLVRAIARDGNALCDHTWDHDISLARRPADRIAADVRRGARAISRAGAGIHPTFFRAPGGTWSRALDRVVRQEGLTPLGWTVDPRDWTRPGLGSILRTVTAELRPGGVILLHDGGGNRTQTLRAVRILLHKLRKQGYHFVVPPTG